MKTSLNTMKVVAAVAFCSLEILYMGNAQDIRKPKLDGDGRFFIYSDHVKGAPMTFVPYAYMPDEAGQMIQIDVDSNDNPYIPAGPQIAKAEATCISVKISWRPPQWAGCAFVSGPDNPAWWGTDDRGWYYDLSGLKKKHLVFYARSKGDQATRIQVKVGILGNKPHGDSMPAPAETRWLTLTPKWTRYELDLSKYTPKQLERICNGFTFVSNQGQNDGAAETEFALDYIYFE